MNILNEINIDINIRQRILDIIIFKRDPKYFFVFKSDFSALSDAGTFFIIRNTELKKIGIPPGKIALAVGIGQCIFHL